MLSFTPVGSMNYNVLRNLLIQGNILQLGTGAEVGVLYGDTSAYLLTELPKLTLYSIDPYVEYKDDAEGRPQAQLNNYEQVAREKLLQFGPRSKIVKKFSHEAVHDIADGSLDFVFIDANHTYESVSQDIALWYSKVRRDGLFCGHDYQSFDGVTQAVNEFARTHGLKGYHTPIDSDIWFFIKP